MVIYFLSLYAIFSVLFYFHIYIRNSTNRNKIIQNIENKISSEPVTEKVLDKIKKIEEIKRIDSPWYEKLVSVIGVTAFISMSVATLVQTYDTYKKEKELKVVEEKVKNMEAKEKELNQYIEAFVNYIMDKFNNNFELEKHEMEILKWKASKLLSEEKIDKNYLSSFFNIMIATKQYDQAINIIEKNKEISESQNIYDKLTLAEYYYLTDDNIMVRKTITDQDKINVPPKIALRFYSLLWLINQKDEKYVNELSKKINRSPEETKKSMNKLVESLEISKLRKK